MCETLYLLMKPDYIYQSLRGLFARAVDGERAVGSIPGT
jgi:hypothetical protein